MDKEDAERMAQAVDNRIVQIAKQVYKQVPNDREVEGLVTSFDGQTNSYSVKINNKVYNAIPQERSLGAIAIGTTVKVKIPNNQMSNAYICGVVDGSIQKGGNGTSSLPLGMIISSAVVQNDAGLHLLDGGELAIGGTYDAFCQYIINNSNKVATCSLAEYAIEISTYGQCGKFVITSTYVKLPTITKFIEGLNDISQLGTSFAAGLPDLTGSARSYAGWKDTTTDDSTGAFYRTYESGNYVAGQSSQIYSNELNLDASRSNSIYGNSNTVQPQSTKYPYYIVVGTVTQEQIIVDINNITADLNNKADKDLGNVTYPTYSEDNLSHLGAGDRVVEMKVSTDGRTWYRLWASGWKECGTYISFSGYQKASIVLPITFLTQTYTAMVCGVTASYGNNMTVYDRDYSTVSVGKTNAVVPDGDGLLYCCGY